LVIAQVALVLILLTGTGLLLRSYANVHAQDTGFSTSAVTLNIKLNPPYNAAQNRRIFFGELLVQAAGAVDCLPLSNTEGITSFELEGYQNEKNQWWNCVELHPIILPPCKFHCLTAEPFHSVTIRGSQP
jgi:hypothetical protein